MTSRALRPIGLAALIAIATHPAAAEDPGPLYLGLQLHIEEQMWNPYQGPGPYYLAIQADDQIGAVFEAHGFPITYQVGLGFAQSSQLWGGAGVPGSAQDLAGRPHEISAHVHFPAGWPPGTFRGRFWPTPEPEDLIPEANLTVAQYCSGITKRLDVVNDILTGMGRPPIRGQCGGWSRRSELRWIPCMEANQIEWVTGWNAFGSSVGGGHAWDTRLTPRRVGRDDTNGYTGGVLDYHRDGPTILLPDGSVSGAINPSHGVDIGTIISLMEWNLARREIGRPNVAYLTTHDYELVRDNHVDLEALAAWDDLLDALAVHAADGRIVYASMSAMADLCASWEDAGGISHPHNTGFETPDSLLRITVYTPEPKTETAEHHFEWMLDDTTATGSWARTDEQARSGAWSLRMNGTGPGGIAFTPGLASYDRTPIFAMLEEGTRIALNAWSLTLGDGSAEMELRFFAERSIDAGAIPAAVVSGGGVTRVEGDWRRLTLFATVPSGAPWVRLALRFRGSGACFWDDVDLRETTASAAGEEQTPGLDSPQGSGDLTLIGPNPFHGPEGLRILWRAFSQARRPVRISVVAADGRCVRDLGRARGDGEQSWTWNGKDDAGQACPSGVYWVVALAKDSACASRRALLLR